MLLMLQKQVTLNSSCASNCPYYYSQNVLQNQREFWGKRINCSFSWFGNVGNWVFWWFCVLFSFCVWITDWYSPSACLSSSHIVAFFHGGERIFCIWKVFLKWRENEEQVSQENKTRRSHPPKTFLLTFFCISCHTSHKINPTEITKDRWRPLQERMYIQYGYFLF